MRLIYHCHYLTFKELTMWNLHKDAFSTFPKLQNLESFDELLINQIMMKMTPKLRWTFPAPVDRIWPSPARDGINTVGILSLSSIVFRQHKNKEEILTMDVWWLRLAQTVRAQTLILKHLNTIWSGMKYGAHILLWILMILLTHKISFYLLATFVRIIRALFPGLNGFLMMVRFLVDKIPDPIAHISQHFPLALLFVNLVTGSQCLVTGYT